MVDMYALTTRAKVQEYRIANGEQLTSTPQTSTMIDNFIDSISSRFESYCDRQFLSRSYTEYSDGKGACTLYPKHYPITDVTSLYNDSDWEWGEDTLVSGTTYRIANENSVVFKNNVAALGEGKQNVKLVYIGGYDTIPYDLENSCINEVIRVLERIPEIALSEKRSNEYLIKYVMSPFLEDTKLVLNKYRRNGAY